VTIGFIITDIDNPTIEASKKSIGDVVVYLTEERAASWASKSLTPDQQATHCIEPVRITTIREEMEREQIERAKRHKQEHPEQSCEGCGICHETETRSAEEICHPEFAVQTEQG